jgi:hypothetical protein
MTRTIGPEPVVAFAAGTAVSNTDVASIKAKPRALPKVALPANIDDLLVPLGPRDARAGLYRGFGVEIAA